MLVCGAPLLRSSPSAGSSTLKEFEALMPNEYWHIMVCALALPSLASDGQTQWEKSSTVGEEQLNA